MGKQIGIIGLSTAIIITLLVIIELMIIGGFYFAYDNLSRLDAVIVDNDGGPVGQFFQKALPASNTLSYRVDNTEDPVGYISDAKTWFIIQIPSNFSTRLFAALNGQSATYANNSINLIYDEGRSFLILSAVQAFLQVGLQQATTKFMQQAVKNVSLANIKDPNVLIAPIPVNSIIVHHVAELGEDIASGLAIFFFMIVSIASGAIIGKLWYSKLGKIHAWQVFILKTIHTLLLATCISTFYSIIVIAFKGNRFHVSSALLWLFMIMVSLTIIQIGEFVVGNLSYLAVLILPVFLIFSLTSSTAVLPLELMNDFYKIGYGFPMLHVVNGLRFIFFGSDNRMGLYVGVIVAWLIVFFTLNTIFFAVKAILAYKKNEEYRKGGKQIEPPTTAKVSSDAAQV